MRIPLIAKRKAGRQSGMSLIELMFAGFILVVGFMGSLILIFIAIATNTRNKVDTTGTMIAQMVIEEQPSVQLLIPNLFLNARQVHVSSLSNSC